MSSSDLVEYIREGDTALLFFNQPETLNALSPEMTEALIASLAKAGEEARAIVLSSRGRGFCSGANLAGAAMDMSAPDRDVGAMLESTLNPLLLQIRDLPVPFITAVRGPAAGFGCAIALMGDLIVAGKSAYFLQAFCNIGLVPDGGSAYLLSRAIGRPRAMELMLLGERYPAEDAFAAGLINRLVDDEEVDATALSLAERLAKGPTKALGLIRRLAWDALDSTFDEQLDRERDDQRTAGRTLDFIEGVSAFLQKRKAEFKGE